VRGIPPAIHLAHPVKRHGVKFFKVANAALVQCAKLAKPFSKASLSLKKRIYGRRRLVADTGSAGCYLRAGLTHESAMAELNRRGVRYVLLRWWRDFPAVAAGEDLDILIDDADLPRVRDVFVERGQYKCDVYSVSGGGRWAFRGIPYFQRRLAEFVLQSRVLHKGKVYVPSGPAHFFSLAYHALYHKGAASGLFGPTGAPVEHDYTSVLDGLRAEVGYTCDMAPGALHQFLNRQGFGPEEALQKFAGRRPELFELIDHLWCDVRGGEMMLFIVREAASDEQLIRQFLRVIEKTKGFELLALVTLTPEQARICRGMARGGKWDAGPFPRDGGGPAKLLVVYDYFPTCPSPKEMASHPGLTNGRLIQLKNAFRDAIFHSRLVFHHFNGVHSCDNEHDARKILCSVAPEEAGALFDKVERKRVRYAHHDKLLKVLSKGRRAKVELVLRGGRKVVRKTFSPEHTHYCRREVEAMELLSRECDFIPPVLEKGEGYFYMPYYEDVLSVADGKPFREAVRANRRRIYEMVRFFTAKGRFLVDFSPHNILVRPDGALICLDLEFMHAYERIPEKPEQAYEVAGVPRDTTCDLPVFYFEGRRHFDAVWAKYVGKWASLHAAFGDCR